MRLDGLLVLLRVAQILVEGLVPGTLDQSIARREVMRGRQSEPCAVGNRIHRLHQRLAEGGFTDDVGAVSDPEGRR